jgi:hypothetical protein
VVTDVVDLEGGVLDTVLAGENLFEVAPPSVAVFVAADEHVGRERRKAGSNGPDVQVVYLRYARDACHAPADLAGVDTWRRAFEQDVDRVAHESPGASQDQQADEDADDRVRVAPSCGEDYQRGRYRADRAEDVG